MTTFYIRSIEDDPHAMDPEVPGLSKCGENMLRAKGISEAQAIIHLGDRRCPKCFPGHQHKGGRHVTHPRPQWRAA